MAVSGETNHRSFNGRLHKANDIMAAGYDFEVELLTTGDVSPDNHKRRRRRRYRSR